MSKNTSIINKIKKETIGIIIIIISIMVLLSMLNFQMGIVGRLLKNTSLFLFGFAAYFLPFILAFIGLIPILNRFKNKELRYIVQAIILLILLTILLDVKNINISKFTEHLRVAKDLSSQASGGGVVGGILGYATYKLFGKVGGILIVGFSIVFNIMLLVKQNIKEVFISVFNFFKSSFLKLKENIKELYLDKKQANKKRRKIDIKDHQENNLVDQKEVEKAVIKDYSLEGDLYQLEESQEEKTNQQLEFDDLKVDENIDEKNIDKEEYKTPPLYLLRDSDISDSKDHKKEINDNIEKIEDTMNTFGIDSKITQVNRGPTITCYELEPAPGVKLNKIVSLSDNLAMRLASSSIRIEAPIPGKAAVGIEVPNKIKEDVSFKEMIQSKEYKDLDSNIPLTLGKDVNGVPIISTIDEMPHLLIAGATGSGKSVCINTIIMSIIYKSTPEDTKLILIDPKVVELSVYNGIPHLLIPVVTDPKEAAISLNWAVTEMERRYELFAQAGSRNIKAYNENKADGERLPNIVIIIDELADLMMVAAKEVEAYISRLAQMARAAGMYLILATQRPSVDVITGTIKANIPSRISFSVSSQIDSRTILDVGGAEKLLGKGDMLYYPSSYSKPKRIQGAFISDDEVEGVVEYLKENVDSSYNENVINKIEKSKVNPDLEKDPLMKEAIRLVVINDQASISMLQRELNMGYNRARSIMEDMEAEGIVGGHEGSKARKVLITEKQLEEMI